MDKQEKFAFITGWPVTHSRSPIIHNHWIEKYELQGVYEKQGFDETQIKDFFKGLANSKFQGGNVTIPYKELAFEMADVLDDTAKKLGAVNTLWVENGKLHGSNTDGYGFFANLDEQLGSTIKGDAQKFMGDSFRGKTAVILGAGGASRPIIQGFLDRGFKKIKVVNRTLSRAEDLVEKFGDKLSAHSWDVVDELLQDADILVNTTSLGMEGKSDEALPLDVTQLPNKAIVYDIIYTPLYTPLLKAAEKASLTVITGLGMLLHQAVPGFERWFGVRPKVTDELLQLVLKDLGQ
jgi:shikimate dehydrogenase